MVITLKKLILAFAGILALIIVTVTLFILIYAGRPYILIGGIVHENAISEYEQIKSSYKTNEEGHNIERFQRPAKQKALKLKYTAKAFIKDIEKYTPIEIKFQSPVDVIHAYYALLKDASNMAGFTGGCGTIGWSKIPYPYAYDLLTEKSKKKITLEEFINSFKGIGYISLLKLYPAYQPPDTPENIKYYMVEMEVITGAFHKINEKMPRSSYFAYYYGLITTEMTKAEEWKIKSIDYLPEDFLCHPMHHWDYDAKFLVSVVYKEWYGLINKLNKIVEDNSCIYVFAEGKGNQYRFDFVRLTNGDDVLLHENILKNGKWTEVNLLEEDHQVYKLSALHPVMKPKE
jgi:hypothetical protein